MNIALTGMMGSGKTTIGRKLIKLLKGFVFVDTDEETVKSEGRTINDIFEQSGEEYFRKKETDILKRILQNDNQIISTGGGILKSSGNIEYLRQRAHVIYLKANAETLYERVKNNKERPLLNCEDMKEKIELLLEERKEMYENSANVIIAADKLTADEIAHEIAGIIK